MIILGLLGLASVALLAITFTALMLVSAWNALREELVPGFRIDPPDLRSIGLALIGLVLPVALIAAFSAFCAIWLLGVASGAR